MFQDVSAFNGVVNLLSFSPYKSAAEALANINAVSEGLLSEQVSFSLFLQILFLLQAKTVLIFPCLIVL
jgi:hypothetical protein